MKSNDGKLYMNCSSSKDLSHCSKHFFFHLSHLRVHIEKSLFVKSMCVHLCLIHINNTDHLE